MILKCVLDLHIFLISCVTTNGVTNLSDFVHFKTTCTPSLVEFLLCTAGDPLMIWHASQTNALMPFT